MWKPLRRICHRVIKAINGDLPEPPPQPTVEEAIRAAKQSDVERHARIQEMADLKAQVRFLSQTVNTQGNSLQNDPEWQDYRQRAHELGEAKQMAGSGPWLSEGVRSHAASKDLPTKLREAVPISAVGAYGDVELALQNVEWRREINLSWLEFSRWGIQQIILISRLYYIKHPWIRRGINLSAAYVFGQGVELSSPDPDANDVLKDFVERNKVTLGQIALIDAERKKSYDGNLFWVLFADTENTGKTNVRMVDATEIQDIICNPDDSDIPWFYRRSWTVRNFDINTGAVTTAQADAWYPSLWYEPDIKPEVINGVSVYWDKPVYHRKCGSVAKWHFGCPRVYPALDWAREGRRFLEAFASVWQALRQIALTVTTKGGQQALEGVKQQMGTTIGPSAPIWDTNPPAVAGATFASGPGTKLEAFKSTGAGGNAEDVKEFRNMVACCLEIPPTWLGDMETSNLSTATTLDRPTELGFLTKQEEWQEDLTTLGRFALMVSARATNGKLKESFDRRLAWMTIKESGGKEKPIYEKWQLREASRVMRNCHWHYEAAKKKQPDVIEVMATFPAIREGDQKLLMDALVEGMTLGNKGGQVVGIDEKAGVRKACVIMDIPNPDELVEQMYPDGTYDPERSQEIEPAPISSKPPYAPGGQPEVQANQPQPQPGAPMAKPKVAKPAKQTPKPKNVEEALARLHSAIGKLNLSESAEDEELVSENGHR